MDREPEILVQMYKQLIEQDTDLHVQLKPGLGKTAFVFEALKSGEVDIYPEFSGTALSTFVKEEPKVQIGMKYMSRLALEWKRNIIWLC